MKILFKGGPLHFTNACKVKIKSPKLNLLTTKLDYRGVIRVFALIVRGWIPQFDVIVATCGHYIGFNFLVFLQCD